MTAYLSEIAAHLRINIDRITMYKSQVMSHIAISGITINEENVIIVHELLYRKPKNVIIGILLHELGHFQNQHFLTWRCGYPKTRELEADEFVGVNMGKFTNQKVDAKLFLESISYNDMLYPSKQERIVRIDAALDGVSTPFIDPKVSSFKNNLYYTLSSDNDLGTVEIHVKEKIPPFKSTYDSYKYLKENVIRINIFGLIQKGHGRNARFFTLEDCSLVPKFDLNSRLIYSGTFRLVPTKEANMEGKINKFNIDVIFKNNQEIKVDD